MDVDVGRWILEFLLRKCDDDGLVKRALSVIPSNDDDPRLKKIVLLRAIESEISEASVSETILDKLEMLEQLEHQIQDSMKAAYSAVALECTAKYLSASKRGKYLEAVKRIWRGRICRMETSGKTQLLTDELKKNRDEVEAAVWNAKVSNKLCRMNTRNDALRLLSVFLGEAWALMGPTLIELAAGFGKDRGVDGAGVEDDVIGWNAEDDNGDEMGGAQPNGVDGAGVEDGGIGGNAEVDDSVDEMGGAQPNGVHGAGVEDGGIGGNADDGNGDEMGGAQPNVGVEMPEPVAVCSLEEQCAESGLNRVDENASSAQGEVTTPKDKETRKANVVLRYKHVPSHRRHRGPARVADGGDLDPATLSIKNYSLSTAEVNKARQSLKSSFMELQGVVTDPLPEAIQRSETVISNLAQKNLNHEPSLQNEGQKESDNLNPSVEKYAETIQSCDINAGIPSSIHRHNNVILQSETVTSNLAQKNLNHEPSLQNEGQKESDKLNPSVDKHAETIQSCDINAGIPSCTHHHSNVTRSNLMNRNSTAHTYEWDDSIDGSPERSRPHLPSPKRKASSPLQTYKITNFSKRRKNKKWSLIEEETLREGVKKFGKGNWKLIWSCYRDVFQERTDVDLKDKWRNMSKH